MAHFSTPALRAASSSSVHFCFAITAPLHRQGVSQLPASYLTLVCSELCFWTTWCSAPLQEHLRVQWSTSPLQPPTPIKYMMLRYHQCSRDSTFRSGQSVNILQFSWTRPSHRGECRVGSSYRVINLAASQ
jgi:hypothetical protein